MLLAIVFLASASSARATLSDGYGLLTVVSSPDVASQITVDGVARNTSSVRGMELPAGSYVVCFDEVDGYRPPPCESVTINDGATTEHVGVFEPAGILSVTIEPDGLAGKIVVEDVPRDRGSVTLPVPAGEHEVCFGEVGGYTTPTCDVVDVPFGGTASTVGTYTPQDAEEEPEKPAPPPEEPKDPEETAPPPEEPSDPPHGGSCSGKAYAFSGDWDGRGRDGLGWWCDGSVKLRTASGNVIRYNYGRSGDTPVVADWNGNGRDTISIVRDGTWHIRETLSGGSAHRSFVFGRVSQGDVPITGDWNRDGRDTIGIIRDGQWHLRHSQTGGPGQTVFTYGRITRGDIALIGDWSGNDRDTIGIVRVGEWHLRNDHAGGNSHMQYIYGRVRAGDTPVMGDWTGNGVATPGIVRNGEWHLRYEHRGGNADRTIRFTAP